jgi:uncharacterized membrane protein
MSDNNTKTTKIRSWFITIVLILFLVLVLSSKFSYAFTVSNVSIQDALQEDLSVQETIKISIIKNNQSNFTFTAPNSAHELYVNNISMNNTGLEISTPLNCTTCQVIISFYLDNVVTKVNSTEFDYSRNLGLPQIPSVLSYTLLLPAGYYLNPSNNPSISPSIVPKPSKIDTDGKNIVIRWVENNPELPKTYYIKYYSATSTSTESLGETIRDELAETAVIWIIFIVLLSGLLAGFFIGQYYHKSHTDKTHKQSARDQASTDHKLLAAPAAPKSLTVPKSLLNPDEKTIITLLQDNNNCMTQRDVGRKLEWSKSKVSAIMTNLEYKKIIEREKQGRNYKVELKKGLDDG